MCLYCTVGSSQVIYLFRKQLALSSNAVDSNANLSKHTRGDYCQKHTHQIWQEPSYPWRKNAHDTGLLVLEKNSVVKSRLVTVDCHIRAASDCSFIFPFIQMYRPTTRSVDNRVMNVLNAEKKILRG